MCIYAANKLRWNRLQRPRNTPLNGFCAAPMRPPRCAWSLQHNGDVISRARGSFFDNRRKLWLLQAC